jgi:ADP-ribosylglycohydrolase
LYLTQAKTAICSGYAVNDIAKLFRRWYRENYWTAHGNVFDIGNTTYQAIISLEKGIPPLLAGGTGENSNGNGSLMRILPMAYLHEILTFPDLTLSRNSPSSTLSRSGM